MTALARNTKIILCNKGIFMKYFAQKRVFLPLMAVVAGILNGLLGAGGGIVLIFALSRALHDRGASTKDVFANALCIMLPISFVSCIIYAIRGNLTLSGISSYALPAILGGILGAILLDKISVGALRKLFSALVIYSGIMLMIK